MSGEKSHNPWSIRGLRGNILILAVSLWITAAVAQDDSQDSEDNQLRQAPSVLQSGGAPIGNRVNLQFPLNPVNDILNIYERLIDKPLVKDSSIFEGPQVSLVTPSDVSRDEAIQLIEAALLVNGYVIMSEEDGVSVKVLLGGSRGGGQSPSFSEGVVIYTDPNLLPDGESLVGFFMELEFVSPEDAATIFGNHIVLNEFGRITPVLNPRGLLITETSPIVRQLIRLRSIIDHPIEDAPLITEFVQLEYAEANIVSQIIQAAMDARMEERQRQVELSGSISGQPRQPQQGGNNGQSKSQQANGRGGDGGNFNGVGTADQPAAQLIPDDRLNRIMVVASPSDAAYILQLIKEFDYPLDNHNPVERKLRYVKANDILPVIVDILQDTGTGQTQLPGGRQIQSRPTPVTSSQLATLTGANRTQTSQNRNAQAGAADEIGGRADQIAFPIDDVAPISVLVGKTRIIADRQSNSIIIIGTGEAEKIVLDMIERLDRKPVQVYLATVIGELVLDDEFELGVDYIQRFRPWDGDDPNRGGFTGGLFNSRTDVPQNNSIADLSTMLTTTPFGPSSGLNLYGQIGDSLDVIISALEATNRFTVLSRPVVYTQNGKRAEITSGQEVPFANSAVTDTSNPNSIRSTVDFKEVVLKLEVLPTINENNEVTLDIVQINDRVVGTSVIDQNEVPVVGKQELNTTVTVANRSTIILGGLISEQDEEGESGIPLLKDIPLIGQAVRKTKVDTRRTELMIFIQPVVVSDDQEVLSASYDEDVRSKVGEAVAIEFPESGVPTIQHQNETIEATASPDVEDNPFKKLGRKLFGKRR
ncbi:MAG: hypothetical protein CMO47_08375 [Verrucomicrobiales bacterium]|nr:hypothetical protein [Verrucomicrobiales bacterium]|tara:strand:+ start:9694 stop:12144 length:2451 start_codon:yes stop_codon:yes gene_type:complete